MHTESKEFDQKTLPRLFGKNAFHTVCPRKERRMKAMKVDLNEMIMLCFSGQDKSGPFKVYVNTCSLISHFQAIFARHEMR